MGSAMNPIICVTDLSELTLEAGKAAALFAARQIEFVNIDAGRDRAAALSASRQHGEEAAAHASGHPGHGPATGSDHPIL